LLVGAKRILENSSTIKAAPPIGALASAKHRLGYCSLRYFTPAHFTSPGLCYRKTLIRVAKTSPT